MGAASLMNSCSTSNRLGSMTTASDVFGPEHKNVVVFLGWEGRGESPAQIATRLAPTFSTLTDRYPDTLAGFYALESDGSGQRVRLADTPGELVDLAIAKSDKDPDGTVGEDGRTRLVARLLPDDSQPALESDAMLTVAAGTPWLSTTTYQSSSSRLSRWVIQPMLRTGL